MLGISIQVDGLKNILKVLTGFDIESSIIDMLLNLAFYRTRLAASGLEVTSQSARQLPEPISWEIYQQI